MLWKISECNQTNVNVFLMFPNIMLLNGTFQWVQAVYSFI